MKIFFLFLLLIVIQQVQAQKIFGTVYNDEGKPLPFSSITVKGSTLGASANDKARFAINLPSGTYTILCQHIGYTTEEKKVTLSNTDIELNFKLSEQKLVLKDVIIKSGGEDPAYEIIRQAIKKRNFYDNQVKAFTCDFYSKDLIKFRKLPKKFMGQKIPDADKKEMGLDSAGKGIIYLSESISKIYTQRPDKFKMEVLSSRVSGSNSFGFTIPQFISLYKNNVIVLTTSINPRGFISPIADGALKFYKYKFLGTFWENGKAINSIRVTPRRTYEPLFSGIINISDEDWRIQSFDLILTKKAQLEILDTLRITQLHVPVNEEVWRLKNQFLYFNIKFFGVDLIGNFLNVYSNYNVNPVFNKNVFNKVIIKYDSVSNKRSKEYWDSTRPVPLEKEEQKDYKVKDSIFIAQKDSLNSQSHIDTLKKRQGKLKPWTVLFSGINRNHYSKTSPFYWRVESLFKNAEYNAAEGVVINVDGEINTNIKKTKTNFSFEPNLRYGTNNDHFNAWANIIFRTRDFETDKKLKRYTWTFSGGKRVSDFDRSNHAGSLLRSLPILLYGTNYVKTYENKFGNIHYSRRFENGLRLSINTLFEDRIPLDNTTNFTLNKKDSSRITPNYPLEKLNAQFTPHQALIASFSISIKPGQRYIEFPNYKMSIGSNYPTFTLGYSKGIKNALGSDVDFDKWKFTVSDDKNLKLAGLIKYKFGLGGFINNRAVFIQDFQHFKGNQVLAASEYVNSFQLANYYANSTVAPLYGIAHLEHHFNGLITNKIPLFKRLKWNLVGGSNAFYVNNQNNYTEVFAGLENIFKIFRVDFIAAYENGRKGLSGIRIGAGGILGGGVQAVEPRKNTVPIAF